MFIKVWDFHGTADFLFYGKGGYLIHKETITGKVGSDGYMRRVPVDPEAFVKCSVISSEEVDFTVITKVEK